MKACFLLCLAATIVAVCLCGGPIVGVSATDYVWPPFSYYYESTMSSGDNSYELDYAIDVTYRASVRAIYEGNVERKFFKFWDEANTVTFNYINPMSVDPVTGDPVFSPTCNRIVSSGNVTVTDLSVFLQDEACGPASVSQAGDVTDSASVEIATVVCVSNVGETVVTNEYTLDWWARNRFPKSITTQQTITNYGETPAGSSPGTFSTNGASVPLVQTITFYSLQAPINSNFDLPPECSDLGSTTVRGVPDLRSDTFNLSLYYKAGSQARKNPTSAVDGSQSASSSSSSATTGHGRKGHGSTTGHGKSKNRGTRGH